MLCYIIEGLTRGDSSSGSGAGAGGVNSGSGNGSGVDDKEHQTRSAVDQCSHNDGCRRSGDKSFVSERDNVEHPGSVRSDTEERLNGDDCDRAIISISRASGSGVHTSVKLEGEASVTTVRIPSIDYYMRMGKKSPFSTGSSDCTPPPVHYCQICQAPIAERSVNAHIMHSQTHRQANGSKWNAKYDILEMLFGFMHPAFEDHVSKQKSLDDAEHANIKHELSNEMLIRSQMDSQNVDECDSSLIMPEISHHRTQIMSNAEVQTDGCLLEKDGRVHMSLQHDPFIPEQWISRSQNPEETIDPSILNCTLNSFKKKEKKQKRQKREHQHHDGTTKKSSVAKRRKRT